MRKIILDLDLTRNNNTVLVVMAKTGVFYETQTGGTMCNHPEVEGFTISLGDYMGDFDDCSFGCGEIQYDEVAQGNLADALQKEFSKGDNGIYPEAKIEFDYKRILDLQEGWWPVIVSGKLNGGILSDKKVNWKGYIHVSNCD